jgi:hypothetical protein
MYRRDPEQSRAASRRYYAGKGRERRHQRYLEQRERKTQFNPAPLERVIQQNWRT